MFFAIFLCCVALASGADRRPTISFITQPEIVTDIGGDIEMKCSIQYAQDYPVIWMKLDPVDRNNDLPITTGTTLILTDPRFHIDLDKSTSTYTLRIDDIQETDGAIYQCQVNQISKPTKNNLFSNLNKNLGNKKNQFFIVFLRILKIEF